MTNVARKIRKSALPLVALLLPGAVFAEGGFSDITWVPQVGVQMKTLEFDQKIKADTRQDSGEGGLDVDIPTISLSLTAIYKKFYVSFKYEDSFDDSSEYSDVASTDSETNTERTDYTITLGYNIWKSMNLFAGFMDGETVLSPEPLCPAYARPDAGFPPEPECGDGGFGFPSEDGNKAQDNYVLGLANYQQNYEEDGWYLGLSNAWRIGDIGTISISVAYADLDASYDDNWLIGSAKFSGQPFAYKFEGEADGVSVGLNWSASLTDHVGYYIDLRRQSYDMSATQSFAARPDRPTVDGPVGVQPLTTRRVQTEETITAMTAGVQWYF